MQGELFNVSGPVVDASKVSKNQTGWMDRLKITLRLDHLAILAILALVLYVLVFSFGVEKGKRFALAELEAVKARQEQIKRELAELERGEPAAPQASVSESLPRTVPGETPPAPAVREERAAPRGRYAIQLITFTSRPRAEEEVERLKKRGYRGFILVEKKFFQVCMDGFDTLGEAREKLLRLKAEGFAPSDAFIRSLKGPLAG